VQAITDLTLTVFRLNGVLLEWGDALVAPLGLTSARWQMLGAIALAGSPLTAPQIADAMGVTRQGAQKQINLLLEQGLLHAQTNRAHRRSPLYALSGRGRRLYEQVEALWAARAAELGASVPPARAAAATAVLGTMLRRLQNTDEPGEDRP
jgi:DNA-binding MarR family transcriptional regulator